MEGVFYSEGREEMDDEAPAQEWCDNGAETEHVWQKELGHKMPEAEEIDLAHNGREHLAKKLRKHRGVVGIRYNGGLLAKVRSLEIRTVKGPTADRVKPRRYQPRKRPFF